MKSIITWLFIVTAAIAGIVDTILSTLDHLRYRATGSLSGGFCQAIMAGGCRSAHSSRYSEILHVPISIYGLGFYCTILFLSLLALFTKPRQRDALLLGAGFSVLSLFYCGFLGYVLYASGNFCPLCVFLYVVNLVLVVSFFLQIRFHDIKLLQVKTIPSISTILVSAAVFFVITGMAFGTYSHALHKAVGERKTQVDTTNTMLMSIPWEGRGQAPVHVLEISDFLCPYCARLFFNLKAIRQRMPDRVNTGFMQYPLDKCNPYVGMAFHPTSCLTALAGICAHKYGKFWQYATILYKNRHRHTRNELLRYAVQIGLNRRAFTRCLRDAATMQDLRKQIEQAHRLHVRGTPTFVINGRVYVGSRGQKSLLLLLKAALRGKNDR